MPPVEVDLTMTDTEGLKNRFEALEVKDTLDEDFEISSADVQSAVHGGVGSGRVGSSSS